MTDLVCLMTRTGCEGHYEISYILQRDDEYITFWMSDRWNIGVHKLKPYEEGDVAMTTGNKIMFGLQILSKYSRNLVFNSGHDEVHVCDKYMTQEEMVAVMSEEDLLQMNRFGWSENYEQWHGFV